MPSDEPFGKTLDGALRELESLSTRVGRQDQVEWVQKVGRPARDRRDGVLRAVTFTASDDHQAIGSFSSEKEPQRYDVPELREVTRRLIHASSTLPQRQFPLCSPEAASVPALFAACHTAFT